VKIAWWQTPLSNWVTNSTPLASSSARAASTSSTRSAIGAGVGAELLPERGELHEGEGHAAGLELPGGHVAPGDRALEPEDVGVEGRGAGEVLRGNADEVDGGDEARLEGAVMSFGPPACRELIAAG
jgi:hypothetical protein